MKIHCRKNANIIVQNSEIKKRSMIRTTLILLEKKNEA